MLTVQAIVPLALTAVQSKHQATRFLLLSGAGHYALLPLLYESREHAIKLTLVLISTLATYALLALVHGGTQEVSGAGGGAGSSGGKGGKGSGSRTGKHGVRGTGRVGLLPWPQLLYLCGLPLLQLYCDVVHPLMLAERLPFLPLLLTSLYCSMGVLWVWVGMAVDFAWGTI